MLATYNRLKTGFRVLIFVAIASGAIAQSGPSDAAAATLSVGGDVPNPFTLTAGDFAKFPRRSVTFQEHDGSKATYQGVALVDLLQKAGAPSGSQLKGKALASYLLATARDGYQVTFTLAELDPAIHDSTVIVADKRDGKPLPGSLGPLRIIAATDKKGARSVRMVEKLQVVLLKPAPDARQ
jgi:DMSO/TMAO reductase YedYZ molybdopterin-dependent catalytic subunit